MSVGRWVWVWRGSVGVGRWRVYASQILELIIPVMSHSQHGGCPHKINCVHCTLVASDKYILVGHIKLCTLLAALRV